MKKKRILLHGIAFSPDGVSTAYLYNDIALAFQKAGFEVTVLTTTPHYNVVQEELAKQPLKRNFLGLFYTSNFKGINVFHVPQKKFKSTLLRILGFAYWHFLAIILGLSLRRFDAILSPSPPLTIGFINLIIGKIRGSKVIYNVQEIYPDFLIEQGGLRSKLIINVLKWLERSIYNNSDAVTTIDQVFYDTIIDRFSKKKKLHIIPNFVDSELYKPLSESEVNLDNSVFFNNDSLKVMYAGNIGHAQDWTPLIEAAKQLKDSNVEFYVIGEGVMKDFIIEKKEELQLQKLHILPYQQRERMPQLLAFSDLQFIFMSKEMEGHGFPSKVYTIMSCKRPLIVCSGVNTPITNFLEPIGCAEIISENDFEKKVKRIVDFVDCASEETLQVMGEKGYRAIQLNYTKEKVTNRYVNLINNLLS
ncbi:glycosyltransferase family 4 protein [Sphingobacterium hotanense]|uniref:glycosyltransferase family 4 protein n=1 Tax=Sphingobacterium hotanense TaxID=649196 RepID=UPI0021A5B015|nr:glycosyltransferase family 4 protein [Sphingobacterium hotanense]MCT1523541.1 glycosyltransferase family 4 protein [Sphingobacterium hotanense]